MYLNLLSDGMKFIITFAALCARQTYGCNFSSLLQGSDNQDNSTALKGNDKLSLSVVYLCKTYNWACFIY